MITIPIVILNYNSFNDCRECICSLQMQEKIKPYFIVVDNCSNADEKNLIKQYCLEQKIFFIEAQENRGYNAGNNIGLRFAVNKGFKYVVVANPDMLFPQKDYLISLIEKMESNPEIVIIGSDIITPENYHQNPISFRSETFWSNFEWVKNLLLHKTAAKNNWNNDYSNSSYCSIINGCCFMVQSEFLVEIGYFDERIFLFCLVSILGKEVEIKEKKMFYEGTCHAIHNHKKGKEGKQLARLKFLKKSEFHYVKFYSGYCYLSKLFLYFMIELKYRLLFMKYRD